uniref:Sodium/potassium-transporting ATPase subunit beta n=1 Tax=Arion vulgaris TaxID=1028688 RepID=A0A0B6YSK9_9EUPU
MEKPTFKQRVDTFCKFMWNSETKELLGRNGRSWAEIGFFYLVFYACLAGFFAATIAGFYQTIDESTPKLQGDSSLLKGNPGMGYEPMPDIETTLIYVTKESRHSYVSNIRSVLASYNRSSLVNQNCTGWNTTRPTSSVACKVDFDILTRGCNEGNAYGFLDGKPCILLKLNRIYGWIPEVWTPEVVRTVRAVPDAIKQQYTSDRIWIDCHGENPADDDNLGLASVEYFPQQGFPLAYYPYLKQKDYRSPLVFVKFNNVSSHLGLMIECKALAMNIEVDRSEKEGSVHFELLVDM